MNFNNLRVSTRLAAAFAVLMTMLLAVTATAWFEMNTMRRSSQDVATNWLPSVEHVSAIESHVHALHAAELQHVLNTDDAAMKRIEGKIGKIRTDLDAERAAYVKLISSSKEQALYDTFAADLKTYLQLHERLLELSRKNQNVQARDLADGESARVFARISTALEALVKLNTEGATAAAAESDARAAARLALDAPRTWQLGNAAINRVLFNGEGFVVIGWNDHGHLEGLGDDAHA